MLMKCAYASQAICFLIELTFDGPLSVVARLTLAGVGFGLVMAGF